MNKGRIIREADGWIPPRWVRLYAAKQYFKWEPLPPEAFKKTVLDTLRGCMTGEREEGSDADTMLKEAAERMEAGRKAAKARWTQGEEDAPAMRPHSVRNAPAFRPHSARNAPAMPREEKRGEEMENRKEERSTTTVVEKNIAYATTDRNTDARGNSSGFEHGDPTPPPATATAPTPTQTRQPGKTRQPTPAATPTETAPAEVSRGTRRVLEKFAADPYGYRDSVPASLLPNVAVVFCDECDETRALTAFQRKLQKMGTARFREILWTFMDDCLHSDPANRGAALMKRLEMLGSLS